MTPPDDAKMKMKSAIEHFQKELKNLRTNRANPGMLDSVQVDVYGSMMPIKALANVTVAEARQLLISPFDPQTAGAISKGIERANLNLLPILEGGSIRIPVPPLNEDLRKEIVKQGRKKSEEAKISIRDVRKKANDLVKKQKSSGDLAEDQQKKMEKQIQELTDQFCKQVDELFTEKEKDILEV